jgi:hypothetical protein
MSCFVCREVTINLVARTVARPDEDPAAIAGELLSMNVAAVNYRYRENHTPEDFGPPFEGYRDPGPVDVAQLYKSLMCYEYQCSEGQPMSEREAELMDRVRKAAQRHEVGRRSPEFMAAYWG